VEGLRSELGQAHYIVALGTNTIAATAMKRAGATQVGVGHRAIADTLPTVDVIVASLNVVLPGAMLSEVTPEIVHAILGARATKVLLPINRARVEIVGAGTGTLDALIAQSLSRVRALINEALPA
jgi:hypothetical protein